MRLFAVVGVIAMMIGCPVAAQTTTPPAAAPAMPADRAVLLGRWNIRLVAPAIAIDTVLLGEPLANGTVQLTIIGNNPGGLSLGGAEVTGAQVRLTGTSVAGPTTILATLSATGMTGTFTAGPIQGQFTATRRPDRRATPVLAMFDTATGIFERNLFTPAPLDAGWQAKRAEFRAALQRPGATERDLVRSVRVLMNTVRLSHNGYFVPPDEAVAASAAAPAPAVTWRRLDGGVGYIRITAFVEDPAQRDRLDAAFGDLADTKGLIVDVRGNGGGNLGLAMRLGDHILPTLRAAGDFATRAALTKAGVGSMEALPSAAYAPFDGYSVEAFQAKLAQAGAVRLMTGGRAGASYTKPVALLIDRTSGSASEALAAVLKDAGRARLFGTRTAGEMLVSRQFPVTDGYIVRLAYADFRTPRGSVAEKVGVAPDEAAGGDPAAVLAAATAWLNRRR